MASGSSFLFRFNLSFATSLHTASIDYGSGLLFLKKERKEIPSRWGKGADLVPNLFQQLKLLAVSLCYVGELA